MPGNTTHIISTKEEEEDEEEEEEENLPHLIFQDDKYLVDGRWFFGCCCFVLVFLFVFFGCCF